MLITCTDINTDTAMRCNEGYMFSYKCNFPSHQRIPGCVLQGPASRPRSGRRLLSCSWNLESLEASGQGGGWFTDSWVEILEDGYFHQRKEVRGGQFRSETFLLLVLPGGLLASVKAVVSTGRQRLTTPAQTPKVLCQQIWDFWPVGPQRGRATFGTAAAAMVLQSHLERSLTHANTPLTSSQLRTTDFAKLILSNWFVQVLESRHCERPAVCELMIFERRHCCAFLSETVAVVLGHYCCSAVSKYNHCTTLLCCN